MDKYTLSDPSAEDQKEFAKGFEELTNKLSLTVSLTINKEAMAIKLEDGKEQTVFVDKPSMIIQKKTLIEEGVVSPLSDEMTRNESTQTA